MKYNPEPILRVESLSLTFPPSGAVLKNAVLSKLSFNIREGEILGIVGDSGSGKTIASLAVAGLLPRMHRLRAAK